MMLFKTQTFGLFSLLLTACAPHVPLQASHDAPLRPQGPGCATANDDGAFDCRTELFFGRGKSPDFIAQLDPPRDCGSQSIVTLDEIYDFLEQTVTPLYPGFTILYADGYWQGEAEIPDAARRPSVPGTLQVMFVHSGGAEHLSALTGIAAQYAHQFCQQSVLAVHSEVSVAFVEAGG